MALTKNYNRDGRNLKEKIMVNVDVTFKEDKEMWQCECY